MTTDKLSHTTWKCKYLGIHGGDQNVHPGSQCRRPQIRTSSAGPGELWKSSGQNRGGHRSSEPLNESAKGDVAGSPGDDRDDSECGIVGDLPEFFFMHVAFAAPDSGEAVRALRFSRRRAERRRPAIDPPWRRRRSRTTRFPPFQSCR